MTERARWWWGTAPSEITGEYYLFVLMKDSAKNCYSITRAVLWIFTLGNVLIAQLETGLLYNGKNTVALCWAVWGLLTCLRDMRTDAENELY